MKQWLERADQRTNSIAHGIGSLLVDGFHNLALFAIGGTIVWSAVIAFIAMMHKGGIYFKTNHMPVRFLIYVGMTALTRMMISDIQAHHNPEVKILYIPTAILVLALATLVVRYGSARFPSSQSDSR